MDNNNYQPNKSILPNINNNAEIVFQPQYYKNFKCIGEKCVNHCCHSWHISIDKSIYDKYMNFDETIRKEFIDKIEVTSEEPFNAHIILDENHNCTFLDEQSLCSIQTRFGHDSLSGTCNKYSRMIYYVNDAYEAFLNLSCKTATKAALFNPDSIKLEEHFFEDNGSLSINEILDASKYTMAENGIDIFWKLRNMSLFIVQDRRFMLWHRLVILGLFIKKRGI